MWVPWSFCCVFFSLNGGRCFECFSGTDFSVCLHLCMFSLSPFSWSSSTVVYVLVCVQMKCCSNCRWHHVPFNGVLTQTGACLCLHCPAGGTPSWRWAETLQVKRLLKRLFSLMEHHLVSFQAQPLQQYGLQTRNGLRHAGFLHQLPHQPHQIHREEGHGQQCQPIHELPPQNRLSGQRRALRGHLSPAAPQADPQPLHHAEQLLLLLREPGSGAGPLVSATAGPLAGQRERRAQRPSAERRGGHAVQERRPLVPEAAAGGNGAHGRVVPADGAGNQRQPAVRGGWEPLWQ